MNRYWWVVEIKTDTGRWVPHWGEYNRSSARNAARILYGTVKATRIRGTDSLRPGVILKG